MATYAPQKQKTSCPSSRHQEARFLLVFFLHVSQVTTDQFLFWPPTNNEKVLDAVIRLKTKIKGFGNNLLFLATSYFFHEFLVRLEINIPLSSASYFRFTLNVLNSCFKLKYFKERYRKYYDQDLLTSPRLCRCHFGIFNPNLKLF